MCIDIVEEKMTLLNRKLIGTLILLGSGFLISCGKEDDKKSGSSSDPNKIPIVQQQGGADARVARRTRDADDLPLCSEDILDEVFVVAEDNLFYVCTEDGYEIIDIDGEDGNDGLNGKDGATGKTGSAGSTGAGGADGRTQWVYDANGVKVGSALMTDLLLFQDGGLANINMQTGTKQNARSVAKTLSH